MLTVQLTNLLTKQQRPKSIEFLCKEVRVAAALHVSGSLFQIHGA